MLSRYRVCLITSLLAFAAPAAHAATAPTRCTAPVYHAFDFWLGDWDTFDSDAPGKPSVARNHVDSILDGCVLREDYDQNDGHHGHHGQSFTIYDANRQLWHQSWVTNRGELLVLEGRVQGKRIVLSGIDHAHHDAQVRASWEPVADGVREIALSSNDGGKSWQPMFDIVFRKHRD